MPFLNWEDFPVQLRMLPLSHSDTRLQLDLDQKGIAGLAQALQEFYEEAAGSPHSELRWVLPQGWVLFWKLRTDRARLLLAHPSEMEWVGTLGLPIDHAQPWITGLGSLTEGAEISLRSFGVVHSVSNFDLTLRRMG